MKTQRWFPVLLIALISFSSCNKQPGILHGKRVMILGNSITQDGRYVDFLEYYLRTNYPDQPLDIISIGLSSETVNGASEHGHPWPRPCVHSRLDNALDLIKPDLVLSCYGMNDGVFSNFDEARFDAYKKETRRLQEKIEAHGAQLILVTPTVFDPNAIPNRISKDGEAHAYKHPYYKYNDVLSKYTNWLLTIDDVPVIDLHHYLNPILTDVQKQRADSTFIPDGVHPNQAGHFLMAKKILMDLYPEVKVGEPFPTINDLNKDELFRLVTKRRKIRSEGWRNYVGYTREKVVKSHDITPTVNEVNQLEAQIKAVQKSLSDR